MTTEENILKQASLIFYQKGLAGARMQEIADKAGINKAMLHYYFKTKEQLFDRVFAQAFQAFAGKIAEVLNSDIKLEDKITEYVNHSVDALTKDPGIPVFVLNELTHHPQRITELFAGKDMVNFNNFREQVEKQTKGKVDPEILFVDMVALCIYPFIAAPIFKLMLYKTDQQYKDLLQSRKMHIIKEILSRL
ncbi:TetR/AcrR family transcriptional regulator [Mucilaginibacter sp. UYNi724]